jgi:serine/threonine protein kinase
VSQIREITEELRLKKVLKTAPQTTLFQAVEPESGREVALKLISPPGGQAPSSARDEFVRTMLALQSLRLDSCPDLLDFGFTPDGSAFMVMELITGVALESYAGLPAARTIPLLMRVLGALEVLAAEGICHHNLRPDNLLVAQRPGNESVQLLGLGSAVYLVNQQGRPQLDMSRELKLYSAPERLDASLPLPQEGWRSDLYSVAMVICRMLEARVVAPASDQPRVDLSRQQGKIGSSERLVAALCLALQRDPARRRLFYPQLRDALGLAMPAKASGADERTERIVVDEHLPKAPVAPPAPPSTAAPPTTTAPPLESQLPEPAPLSESQLPEPESQLPEPAAPLPAAPEAEAVETGFETVVGSRSSAPGIEQPAPAMDVPLPAADASQPPAPASPPPSRSAADAPPTIHLEVPEHLPPPLPRPASAPPPLAGQDQLPGPAPSHPPEHPDALPEMFPAADPLPEIPAPSSDSEALSDLLPEAGPPQPPVPQVTEAPPSKPAPPAKRKKPTPKPAGKGMSKTVLAAVASGAVVVLALIVAGVIWGIGKLREPEPVEPVPVVVLPTPTPQPTPDPALEVPAVHANIEQAESLVLEGDFEAARVALEAITEEEIALFTEEESYLYEELMASVTSLDITPLVEQLRAGLSRGDIESMRPALTDFAAAEAEQIAGEPGLLDDLERAQQAIQTFDEMWAAQGAGNHVQVIERAGRLIALLPEYGGSYDQRERAASAIETKAQSALQSRDYDTAIGQLEELRRVWPTRPGLTQKINEYGKRQSTTSQLERVLRSAETRAAGGDPEEALRMIDAVRPTATFQERYADARSRYQAQLAEMDRATPEVEIASGFELRFKKGQTVRVPLRIKDDYRIASAKAMVRSAARSTYSEIDLQHAQGSSYYLEITPAIHGNKSVHFYVIATDRSGHTGRLGSAEQPLELKKRWLR